MWLLRGTDWMQCKNWTVLEHTLIQDIELIVMQLCEHPVISSNLNPQFSFHSRFFNNPFYKQHKIPYGFPINFVIIVSQFVTQLHNPDNYLTNQMSHISVSQCRHIHKPFCFSTSTFPLNEAICKTVQPTEGFSRYECNGESLSADWCCQKIYWQHCKWNLALGHSSYWLCDTWARRISLKRPP